MRHREKRSGSKLLREVIGDAIVKKNGPTIKKSVADPNKRIGCAF